MTENFSDQQQCSEVPRGGREEGGRRRGRREREGRKEEGGEGRREEEGGRREDEGGGGTTWELLEVGDCFGLLTLCNVQQLLPIGREVEGAEVDWGGRG